jgi:hypothetical protein
MLELGLVIWLIVLALVEAPAPPPKNVDFKRDVQPILEKRCQPCHFPGGKMHAKLPFDRAETIDKLGTKLFTRIKKDDEQAIVRAFIARNPGVR